MKKILLCLLLLSVSFVSCNKAGEVFYEDTAEDTLQPETTRALQSVSDPFAIDVMQRAMDMVGK